MNKLVAFALVALVAGTATAANAFPLMKPVSNKAAGEVAVVGEPFTPFAKVADVRETCELEGGIAKRQLDDAGNLVWVCIR